MPSKSPRRGRKAAAKKNSEPEASKYSVLSSFFNGNSQMKKVGKNKTQSKKAQNKNSKQSWSGMKMAAVALPVVLSLLLISPDLRWNLVLLGYMPTMSGLYFQLEWLLEDYRRAYLEFEMWAFPSLFQLGEVAELTKEEYTWEKFYEASHGLRRPVVVRGLFNDAKAVQEFGTDEWLSNIQDIKIQTVSKQNGNGFKYDYELEERDFHEFINSLKAGNFEYGYGLDEIYYKYPNLVDDLELERLGRHNGKDYNFCQSIALFIGATGTGLRWHNADHANMAFMVQGSKTFHLIEPKYSMFMGPDGNEDPYATGFAARSPPSIINKLPEYKVTVGPGDALYTPTWWWHAIETFGDKDTGMSILNTCRFGTIFASVKNAPVLELVRHQGFINWLHPKIPTMARFIPYFRLLQDGIRELTNNMPYWDSDDCYSSKKRACEKYFKSVGWM